MALSYKEGGKGRSLDQFTGALNTNGAQARRPDSHTALTRKTTLLSNPAIPTVTIDDVSDMGPKQRARLEGIVKSARRESRGGLGIKSHSVPFHDGSLEVGDKFLSGELPERVVHTIGDDIDTTLAVLPIQEELRANLEDDRAPLEEDDDLVIWHCKGKVGAVITSLEEMVDQDPVFHGSMGSSFANYGITKEDLA